MRLIQALAGGRKQLADEHAPRGFTQPAFWTLGPSPLADGRLFDGSEQITVPFER